jgi:carotenoid 9,10(9',10')-cleavage dioxygenase 1
MFGKTGLVLMLMHRLMMRLGITSKANGAGTGNTALVFHAKKLLALHEGDLPYQVHPPALLWHLSNIAA